MEENIDPNKLSDRDLDWYVASLFLELKGYYEKLHNIWVRDQSKKEADFIRESITKAYQKLNAALDVDHFRRESMR
jgi:hypothetical protein